MTPTERAKQLTESHWNGYIKPLLLVHGTDDASLEIIGFHYLSSGQHFYGHAIEDERNGMFAGYEDEEEALPLDTFYLHGNLCDTCARTDCNKGEYPATKDGGCEGYIKAEAKQDTPTAAAPVALTICPSCSEHPGCKGQSTPTEDGSCNGFSAKKVELHELPSIALGHTADEVWAKWQEELAEFLAATPYSMHAIVERWDCLQALQTHRECGGHSPETYAKVALDLSLMHKGGLPVVEAKTQMLLKNARRGYYAPEVNAVIIESNGHSFTPKEADA